MIPLKKVSIIGCGNVGMRYAYALIISGLAREIVLFDLDKKRLEGEVMDLSHGAPYVPSVDIRQGEYPDVAGSDLVVITAGRNQSPGQTRLDLVKGNVEIYKQMIPEITKYADKSIFLIVSNPVDVLSYAAYKFSGKPANEIIGSGTVLDTARFRFHLAKHCNVDPHNIHAYILGEHGDTEFAVWSRAMLGGILFSEYCPHCNNAKECGNGAVLRNIFEEVKTSAYKIIERKKETSYGIGLALVQITRAILNDGNSILPVSSLLKNYLGISDVYMSIPSVVGRNGIREVLQIKLNNEEEKALNNSAQTIQSVLKSVGL